MSFLVGAALQAGPTVFIGPSCQHVQPSQWSVLQQLLATQPVSLGSLPGGCSLCSGGRWVPVRQVELKLSTAHGSGASDFPAPAPVPGPAPAALACWCPLIPFSCWLLTGQSPSPPFLWVPHHTVCCAPYRMAVEATTGGVTMTNPTSSLTRRAKSSASTSWKGDARG